MRVPDQILGEIDFSNLIPIRIKDSTDSLFNVSSLGISTNRDEWVYDVDKTLLGDKIKYFIKEINKDFKSNKINSDRNSINTNIKWNRDLKSKFS